MAYFNHAFQKTFLATKGDQTLAGTPGTSGGRVELVNGVLQTAGIHVSQLKSTAAAEGYLMGPGVTGFFGKSDNLSIDPAAEITVPFYIASAAIKLKDKQGPFHGGYQESNKSKIINPKYINRAWTVESNAAARSIVEIGWIPGQADLSCAKDFFCDTDYNLRIEVKGSDALRFANHNLYQTLMANGGCCVEGSETDPINAASIYVQWAQQIAGTFVWQSGQTNMGSDVGNAYLKDFIRPIIVVNANATELATAGDMFFAASEDILVEEGIATSSLQFGGTFDALATAIETGTLTNSAATYTNFTVTNTAGADYQVGLILLGAYEETSFADCTFTPSDYYSVEPLKILVSEVDLNGDPCAFTGLCVNTACAGMQANGLGETVAREVILHEAYLQNFMHSDLRIREITQGTDIWNVVNRTALYDKFYLLHSVPRFNNPSSVFDNDQYLLCIVTDDATALENILPADVDHEVFDTSAGAEFTACAAYAFPFGTAPTAP